MPHGDRCGNPRAVIRQCALSNKCCVVKKEFMINIKPKHVLGWARVRSSKTLWLKSRRFGHRNIMQYTQNAMRPMQDQPQRATTRLIFGRTAAQHSPRAIASFLPQEHSAINPKCDATNVRPTTASHHAPKFWANHGAAQHRGNRVVLP
jgi:hypothetical protein